VPYKDPEAKRRYMSRYYEQKIKTGAIPCTASRKRSYGLTASCANKTRASGSAILASKSGISQPISPPNGLSTSIGPGFNHIFGFNTEKKKPARPRSTGGAEYKERVPKGFTNLGNGVVMRFIKPGET
jgi:hypothetical protein